MGTILFKNATVFDGWSEQLLDADVVVENDCIMEVSDGRSSFAGDANVIDCDGCVLMPGLIDAHVHVYASSIDLARVSRSPMTYNAHHAANFLKACLDRGYTTVRDVGGGDVGLASALRDGLLRGPRFFYGGRVVSQTGGHGDTRFGEMDLSDGDGCGCSCHADPFAIVADGVDAVHRAVREELRRGASHIKIMGSGGVFSSTSQLDRCQYSDEEIGAAVSDAVRAGKYVAAHCHPAEAIRRCVRLGVRSIEHATIIDQETAEFVAAHNAYTVPTMAIIFALLERGDAMGMPRANMEKLRALASHALTSLEVMKQAGVKMGHGTDLLGPLHTRQSSEFELRSRVLSNIEILRSACRINAEIMYQDDQLGCVKVGARADLLVVNGNPLEDISLLGGEGEDLAVVMSAGHLHKNTL